MDSTLRPLRRARLDKIGIVLSIACAAHCLISPVVLLLAPALGEWWDHPLAHWTPAALILPVAGLALGRGLWVHRRWGVLVLGLVGLGLVSGSLAIQAASPEICTLGGETDVAPCCIKEGDEATGTLGLATPGLMSVAGGIVLVLAHLVNLRCCSACRAG